MNKILAILIFTSMNLFAGSNLIKDSEMKKFDKYWKLGKKSEFSYVKPVIKRGEFNISTKHTAEASYLALRTAAKLKYGESYKLTFDAKMDGQGQMTLRAQVGYDDFDGKKPKAKRLTTTIIQGLGKVYEPTDGEWKKITCHFTVDKETPRGYISVIVFRLGAFEGDVNLRNFELIVAKNELKKRGGSIDVAAIQEK